MLNNEHAIFFVLSSSKNNLSYSNIICMYSNNMDYHFLSYESMYRTLYKYEIHLPPLNDFPFHHCLNFYGTHYNYFHQFYFKPYHYWYRCGSNSCAFVTSANVVILTIICIRIVFRYIAGISKLVPISFLLYWILNFF